jgi:type IV pilus assembly protein PilW
VERIRLAVEEGKEKMGNERYKMDDAFTMVELLVAMTLSIIVMGAIFLTFKSQQDSYVVQGQVSQMQQNARAAMYLLTRDIQMAGYYTNFVAGNYTMDWDDLGGTASIRPLIYGKNNLTASGVKTGTDLIVIVKASDKLRFLGSGEGASGGVITLSDRDLDSDGVADLDDTDMKYGMLIKSDLTKADFFQVNSPSGIITPPWGLSEEYVEGDIICRADILVYQLDDQEPPSLVRKNLGDTTLNEQAVAESIDEFRCRYLLADGSWVSDPSGSEPLVRAVEISLLARTGRLNNSYVDTKTYTMGGVPVGPFNDGYRRRLLTSIVKTRNIGL